MASNRRTFSIPSSGDDDSSSGVFSSHSAGGSDWGERMMTSLSRSAYERHTRTSRYDDGWQWRHPSKNSSTADISEYEGVSFSAPPADIPQQGVGLEETIEQPTTAIQPSAVELQAGIREKANLGWREPAISTMQTPERHPDFVRKQTASVAENVIARDERLRISPCNSQPYRWICSLIIHTRSGLNYAGTGSFSTMMGRWAPGLILTCAHNLYMPRQGGYVDSITIYPGRDGSRAPMGTFKVQQDCFRVPDEWIQYGDSNYDYGAIFLPDGFTNAPRSDYGFGYQILRDIELQNRVVDVCGYPADKMAGTMWIGGGRIARVQKAVICYDTDTKGGQSGSPVWTWNNYNWMVIGIHGYGGDLLNSARRITPDFVRNVTKWSREVNRRSSTNSNVFPDQ